MAAQLAADLATIRHRGTRRFLRMHAVMDATGLGRATIYELISEQKFPKPVKLLGEGSKAVGWIENGVIERQEARIAERDDAAG